MIPTFTCWKWHEAGYRSAYTAREVHVLRNMIRRHYAGPHVFCCVTDDAEGIDPDVKVVPMSENFAMLKNPSFRKGPNCYRRLFGFSDEARTAIGERIVSMDLDVVITNDIAPLIDRPDEFVAWGDALYSRPPRYNGSFWMVTAGARRRIWDSFDPLTSPQQAHEAGYRGSDQGWISFVLGRGEKTWNIADGVYSYRVHVIPKNGELPPDARIVIFHGLFDPWGPEAQELEWVRQHYR